MRRAIGIGIAVLAVAAGATALRLTSDDTGESLLRRVRADYVCMINNRFLGRPQIPVPVDGKVYYGCCAGCVKALTENTNGVRFARDPVSGATVDKAQAVIGALPDDRVLYFESEETFTAFARRWRR